MSAASRARAWGLVTAACASLALLLVVAGFALSGRRAWTQRWPNNFALDRGRLILLSPLWVHPPADVPDWTYDLVGPSLDPIWPPYRRIGTRYSTGPVRWGAPMHALVIPLWALAAIPALLALPPALRARRWRRLAAGDCPACGYSRSGLRPDAPCPECGAPPRVSEPG